MLANVGSNIDAIEAEIAIKLDESFLPAWGNIGTAFINGRHQEALPFTEKFLSSNLTTLLPT